MNQSALDFSAIAGELLPKSLDLLKQWFPAGKLNGREFKVGSLKGEAGESLSVNIDTGLWADFSEGKTGKDLIALYAAIHGINQGQAAKKLSNGHAPAMQDIFIIGETCHPIPSHKHGRPVGVYEYKNLDGITYGYVCRFQPLNQDKEFAPLTFWQTPEGKKLWRWKKWPIDSQPYHAELIKAKPEAKILIVEGEAKADSAQKRLPDWLVLGWCGGAGAVAKTDWQALKFRYCWIWGDNDEPGQKAAKALKKILPDLHIVALPEGLPEGWDLADAADNFDIEKYLQSAKPLQQITIKESENLSNGQSLLQHLAGKWIHTNSGKPLGTIDNLKLLLQACNYTCHYNVISKRNEIVVPGEAFTVDNIEPASLACIYSRMKEVLMPVEGYVDYLLKIGDENRYNPVMLWVESKPWDGNPRFQQLYDTIQSPETEAKELLIRRWLITALSLVLKDGVDSAGCLVLQGATNLGKTWWARKLLAEDIREELFRSMAGFDPHDRDNLSQLIRFWIVELGDIGSTFRKADIDALKNFITDTKDVLRRPYGKGDQVYARRTAIIASVDQDIYLHDTAGNRRFWTIPCTSINSYHTIDMQQLWAEVLVLIKGGEGWKLEGDELAHIMRINENYGQIDPIEEMIMEKFRWDEFTYISEWKTATKVAEDLGLRNITPKETRSIAGIIAKRNGGQKRLSNGQRLLLVPAVRSAY